MSQDTAPDTIMSGVYRWLEGRPRPARIRTLAVVTTVAVAAVAGAAVVDLGDYAALVGSPAGIALFAVALGWWATVATPEQADRVNIKARVPLPRRRFLAGLGAAAWAILVLSVGKHIPDVVAGTLTVVVAATLLAFFRATPPEAALAAMTAADATDATPPTDAD